jgi:hypothetical protein
MAVMHERNETRPARRPALVVAALLAVVAACAGGAASESPAATPSAMPSPTAGATATPSAMASRTAGATATPLPYNTEAVAIEAGTYRIPESYWSHVDFTVTIPAGWTVQYGHVYAKPTGTPSDLGFYAVVVDAIYADSCVGSNGDLMAVGPGVDDLAAALLQQPGPLASGPVATTLGGYPATRIDLTVPEGFDLEACTVKGVGLQIWYSRPADKYFVLQADEVASVYILDVDGQRQVFMAYRPTVSDADPAELQAVLDSIVIQP